jgi:hypothetical protein
VALDEREELELLTLEREKAFSSTSGGAAIGNPNLRRQGEKQKRDFGSAEPFIDIGGATAGGAAIGAVMPEILTGAGNVIGGMPQPFAQTIGRGLTAAGQTLKATGRAGQIVGGAIGGAVGETAGQTAEALGAGPVTAEAARIVGGMAGPGAGIASLEVLRKYAMVPALGLMSKFKHEAAKTLIQKIDSGGFETLNDQEKALFTRLTGELRGGPKSDESLAKVGGAMEKSAIDTETLAAQNLNRNRFDLDAVVPGASAEPSDVGIVLRDVITKRNAKMKEVNDSLYKANEKARDELVKAQEAAGNFINKTADFKSLVADLRGDLSPGKRSADVQKTYQNILSQIGVKEPSALDKALASVGGEQPKEVPLTFQALDDVRRSLGEVFRGKPPEGYAAISADDARRYYAKISEIQKNFAGGEAGPQAKLLDDYARGKEGLEPFISARGRKATALDRYDDKQFVTDAAALPNTYFKSRTSLRALKQLTGDEKLVEDAALSFVNKKLEGADSATATKFMRDNSDWLRDLPRVNAQVETYAARRGVAEIGVKRAEDFAAEAASTKGALIGNRYPVERVRNLVQNGNMDLWEKAGPAIANSQEGRANILTAVRQTLAEKPMTPERFSRTIRPALKTSGLADDAALDLIENKLRGIQEMKIPDAEKLPIMRRIALQATSGYSASVLTRGAVEAAKMVPD